MKNSIIAASILSADIAYLGHEVQDVVNGGTDWLHLDVMDGSFVPPITFGANVVSAIKANTDRFIDVHLMINEPEKHVESFAKAGADLISIHYEACPHAHRAIQQIKNLNIQAGIAINPGTNPSSIEPLLSMVDLVLVMTVNPGWGGQSFIENTLSKVSWLNEERANKNYRYLIEVDGGINPETAKRCYKAGVDVFVAGSYIFSAKDRKSAISLLRESLKPEPLLN